MADLSRIELTEEEIERFSKEFDAILGYVDSVMVLAKDASPVQAQSAVQNVFREDSNPHESGAYSEALLMALPSRKGQFAEVKKILG